MSFSSVIKKLHTKCVQPIEVVVYWEEARYVHHTSSQADALTWMNCYPVDAVQFVYNRFGKLQAMRSHTHISGIDTLA